MLLELSEAHVLLDRPFLLAVDYASYVECQGRESADVDPEHRSQRQVSSDRAIAEYGDDIWNVLPATVSRPSS